MVDTYNYGDGILIEVWATMNLAQEPFVGFLGLASDDLTTQFWSTLESTDGGQEVVWGQACSNYSNCQHSNLVRQWAELSFWFPARGEAAGAGPLSGMNSLNFSAYAPPAPSNCYVPFSSGCALFFSHGTHSYLMESPYSSVSPAWQQIQGVLK